MQIRKSSLRSILTDSVLLLFFLAYAFKMPLFSLVGILLMLGMLVLFDGVELFISFAFLLPNTYLIKLQGFDGALVGYWLVLIVGISLLRLKKTRFDKTVFLCFLVHLLCITLSVVLTENSSTLGSFVRFTAFLLILQLLGNLSHVPSAALTNAFASGCLSAVGLSLLDHLLQGKDFLSGGFRSIGNDRNYFAVTVAFAIAALLVHMQRERCITVGNGIKTFILFLAGILSASRTFAVLSLLLFFAVLCMSKGLPRRKKIWFACLLLLFAAASLIFFRDSFALVIERFQNTTVSGANGRLHAWRTYLQKTFSSPVTALFGVGNSSVHMQTLSLQIVEHNAFVQSLFTIGLAGTLSLSLLILAAYRAYARSRRHEKKHLMQYIPLFCILLGYCTINGLYSSNLSFCLVLSFLLLCPAEAKASKIGGDLS